MFIVGNITSFFAILQKIQYYGACNEKAGQIKEKNIFGSCLYDSGS